MNKNLRNLQNKSITVIIPTYNEKENIKILINKIYKYLPKGNIVVVDDSPDNSTVEQIGSLKKRYKSLFVIKRTKKSGRGSAVLDGMKFAVNKLKTDYYIEMDADLSHDAAELPSIVDACRKDTIVEASRYVRGSKIINWPLERRIASKVSNLLVKIILQIPLHDNTNGFRAYPKDAVSYVLKKKFISKGYIVLSEMSYILKKKKYKFLELPSTFYNRRKGRSNANIQEFVKSFRDLILIRLQS